jgi:hypothetical protein
MIGTSATVFRRTEFCRLSVAGALTKYARPDYHPAASRVALHVCISHRTGIQAYLTPVPEMYR